MAKTAEKPGKTSVFPARAVSTIQDIFLLAGNSTQLAARLGVHAFTVENWRRCGIPQKYWDRLCEWFHITPADLFTVSKACRAATAKASRGNKK